MQAQATTAVADHRVIAVLRAAEAARPEVRLEDWDGLEVVVKDYTVRATAVKLRMGRFLVRREYAAHARLEGLKGVPPAVPSGSRHIFAHVYVPGCPVTEVREPLTQAFFEELRELVDAIHRRATAHGDLTRLQNVLVQPDGSPALIDFSAAIVSGSNPLACVLLSYMQNDDLRAIAKIKQRQAPHLVTEEDLALLRESSRVARGWRWVRSYLRPWLQKRTDPGGE